MGRPVAVRRLLRRDRPGLLQGPRARRLAAARRPEHQQRPGRRDRRRGHRDRLAAEHAPVARGRHGPGLDRPDLPALRDPDGVVQGRQHHRSQEHGRQEDRQLARRQRARAVRGPDQGRARPDQGERHQAELRHVGAAQGRSRRRPGDDLQRVRPGARGEEPGDRRALHAGRPQRRRLQRPVGRDGDAPGPGLRQRQVAQDRQQRRHRHQVPAGDVQGLDLLPRQPPEVRRHRARQGLAARRQPPGVADERDQRADLAVPERDRPARQDALRPDHPDRHDLQGPEGRARPPMRPAPTSPRRPSTRSARRSTPRVPASRRAPSPSRRAATSRSRLCHVRRAGSREPALSIRPYSR